MAFFGFSNGSIRLGVAALFLAGMPAAYADLLYDSGTITFNPTGTQYGRLTRNGVPSDWSVAKAFPGVTGAPVTRTYELFALNSGVYPYLQVDFDDPGALFFVSAYLGSYNPNNLAPNYGLDTNYLGDAGSSGNSFGNPGFFQVAVAPGTDVVFVVSEVNQGGGAGGSFDLMVEGFLDTDYTGVPEPGTFVLLASAAGMIVALRRRSFRSE